MDESSLPEQKKDSVVATNRHQAFFRLQFPLPSFFLSENQRKKKAVSDAHVHGHHWPSPPPVLPSFFSSFSFPPFLGLRRVKERRNSHGEA